MMGFRPDGLCIYLSSMMENLKDQVSSLFALMIMLLRSTQFFSSKSFGTAGMDGTKVNLV